MKLETTYTRIWQVSYPIILGNIAQTAINITDSVFLGKVNQDVFDASAIAGLMHFLLFMIGVAFGNASQIIIARRGGEQRNDLTGEVIDHTFYLFIGISLFSFFLMKFVFPVAVAELLNSREIASACKEYFEYRSWGIFFTMFNIVFRAFYTGTGKTGMLGWNIGIMAVVNAVLCYLFIFGNFGFPQMGIAGAALASNIAEVISTIIYLFHLLYKKQHRVYSFFRLRTPSFPIFKSIIGLSLPMILQHIFGFGGWLLFFVFIEKLGKSELTVSNLVRLVYMVVTTPVWAYSSATNTLVSNVAGQNKPEEVFPLVKRIINISLLTNLLIIVCILIMPGKILALFSSDSSLTQDGIYTLYIVCLAMLPLSVSGILLSSVSGLGNTKASMLIEVLSICIYLIYVFLVTIVFHLSVETAWCSEILYWVLTGIFSLWYLQRIKWKSVKI